MRICFIGDELVAGVGDPRGLGWVGRVNAHSTFDLPATFLTLAVPSETTKQMAARWEAEGSLFALEWVDPARPALAGRGKGDPEDFMRHTSEFVNRSIVLHSQVEVGNGTTVTAWVRRGEDGLFSVLTADGPLDADGQREADALEARVRDAVGLD